MERRLSKLEIVYRRRRALAPGDEAPFAIARLTTEQRAEMQVIAGKIAEPSATDPYGLHPLSVYELERLEWLSAVGRGIPMAEPEPEPSQEARDRRAVASLYARIRQPDGTLDRRLLHPTQQERLAELERRVGGDIAERIV